MIGILANGGCTFAEHPRFAAPEARIIWHADFDPGTLDVAVVPVERSDPDHVALEVLAPWLTVVTDRCGREHAVLSDGWRHIRLDVQAGSLACGGQVLLFYRIKGVASARARLLPLRRFLDLVQHRRFTATSFPREPRIERWLQLLRVHDARAANASQREIGQVLFGPARVEREWNGPSDSLKSRVRRLVYDAATMARGGYRLLMRNDRRSVDGSR